MSYNCLDPLKVPLMTRRLDSCGLRLSSNVLGTAVILALMEERGLEISIYIGVWIH